MFAWRTVQERDKNEIFFESTDRMRLACLEDNQRIGAEQLFLTIGGSEHALPLQYLYVHR